MFGPLKGSCRAEGEEKITGADIICFCHVDLTSGLTHCGPVLYGCQVDVPAHMLQHDVRTSPTRTDTHVRGQNVCVQGQRSASHTPTQSCAQTDACWVFAFSIIFTSFPGSCCRDRSYSLHQAPLTIHTVQHRTCARAEETTNQ